ncbi:hypothetical protein VTK26DRAFT_3426 [Humicola hyalothermophila]
MLRPTAGPSSVSRCGRGQEIPFSRHCPRLAESQRRPTFLNEIPFCSAGRFEQRAMEANNLTKAAAIPFREET